MLLVILLLPGYLSMAQSLKEVSRTIIPLGKENSAVGLEKGEGEHWKPLFFSVSEGLIHIPDFYKGRIALFDRQGELKQEKKAPQGISPRMNYFSLSPSGYYVTFDNGTLFCLNNDGSLNWQRQFGLGVIPSRIFVNQVGIFVVFGSFMDEDGRSLVFTYTSPQPLGRFGHKKGDTVIPMITTSTGKAFALSLNDMALLPDTKTGAFGTEQDASLLFVDQENRSFWFSQTSGRETIYLYDQAGALLSSGTILFPDGREGTGFWTCMDAEGVIYKNYFFDNQMEIAGYEFR